MNIAQVIMKKGSTLFLTQGLVLDLENEVYQEFKEVYILWEIV